MTLSRVIRDVSADSPRAGRERLITAFLSLLFTAACFFEYLPPFKTVHLWSDIAGYHYPLQVYAFHALKDGKLPLWDSSIYSGISFVGNIQAAFLYPPTWLMYLAAWSEPRIPFKVFEVFAFLHIWLAFLLCYLWLRGRAGKMGSALGAAAFAYSGFMMYEVLHPGVAFCMTWLPLGLWGIDEAEARRDWRPLWKLAVASALAFLAGYPAAWLASCVLSVAYALFRRWSVRDAAYAALALGGSLLLAAMQLLPALEGRALMFQEPKYGPAAWSLPTLLRSFLFPNWFDFNPGHPAYFEPGCIYLYLGLPLLFAIAWAVREHRFRPFVQPAAGLALCLVMASPPALLLRLIEKIPALENSMQPFNYYSGVSAMAALVTALGVDRFLKARPATRSGLPRWAAIAAAVAMAGWTLRQGSIWKRGGHFPTEFHSLVPFAIALTIFIGGLWTYRASRGQIRMLLAALLLLLVGVDYKVYGSGRWFNAMAGDVDNEFDAKGIRGFNADASRLLLARRIYRIALDEGAAPYSTDLRDWGLTTPQGFDPFLPAQYRTRIEQWVPFKTNRTFFLDLKNEKMLQTLGVGYVISHQGMSNDPYLAASPSFQRIGPDNSYYRVYEFLNAQPVYRWEPGSDGKADPVGWSAARRELEVDSTNGGRFILVEQHYPGWQARVDGRPVPIERWDGAFDAIQLTPGHHRVTFLFRPTSLYAGAGLTLLALVGLAVIVISDLRRGRVPATAGGGTAPHTRPSHEYGRPWPGLPTPEPTAGSDSNPAAPAASPGHPAAYRARTTSGDNGAPDPKPARPDRDNATRSR
jgi:hypothetical protein